eukprot:UN04199
MACTTATYTAAIPGVGTVAAPVAAHCAVLESRSNQARLNALEEQNRYNNQQQLEGIKERAAQTMPEPDYNLGAGRSSGLGLK